MKPEIEIEEVVKENIAEFWDLHWEYLNRDIFPYETLCTPSDEEDREYFHGREYRGVMEGYMEREPDKAHMIYFCRDGRRIGCCEYVTYKSEDGKCFLMDFWVFPKFRGSGIGRACFATLKKYAELDGAKYFQINISNEKNRNFWMKQGFTDAGQDEWGEPLMELLEKLKKTEKIM